jgi:hypothetical protein
MQVAVSVRQSVTVAPVDIPDFKIPVSLASKGDFIIDYVAVMAPGEHTFSRPLRSAFPTSTLIQFPIARPHLKYLENHDNTFFILQPKGSFSVSSEDQLSQAAWAMYSCAVKLEQVSYVFNYSENVQPELPSFRKDFVRGALTNGQEWIFIILEMNPDGSGAKYLVSNPVSIIETMVDRTQVSHSACRTIPGIIAHWASHPHFDPCFPSGVFPILTETLDRA